MEFLQYDKSDAMEIYQLFKKVFSDSEGESEGDSIGNLVLTMMNKTAPEDISGYVASESDQIIGCIFFTRLMFDTPIDAFILAPVAVDSGSQGQGVGQELIKYGIDQLRERGVNLVFTYGDPAFYSKTGFRCISEKVAKAPWKLTQPEGWLCQALKGGEIRSTPGNSSCVEALNKSEYW